MLIKLFRLVTPAESVDFQSGTMPAVIVAHESAELAAMLSEDLLWNQRHHAALVRETLVVPSDPGLHQHFGHVEMAATDLSEGVPRQLAMQLAHRQLLCMWLPTCMGVQQHSVLLNTRHPAFSRIRATRRQITLTRPTQRTRFQIGEAQAVVEPRVEALG